ncbi:MAG: hypothetical protein AAF843_00145 [Bacteroidota bacterium]
MQLKYKIAITFLLILIIGVLILWSKLDAIVENKAKNYVQKLSQDSYKLGMTSLDVSLFPLSLNAKGITLDPVDSQYILIDSAQSAVLHLNTESIEISKINLWDLLFNNKLAFSIKIDSFQTQISFQDDIHEAVKLTTNNSNGDVEIDLELNGGKFDFKQGKESLSFTASAEAYQLKNNSDLPSILQLLQVDLSSVNYITSDGIFSLGCDSLTFHGSEKRTQVKNFYLKSIPAKYKLGQVLGHEADWIDLEIRRIEVLNLKPSVGNDTISIDSVLATGLSALIFRDKRLKFPTIPDKPLPHELFQKLPLALAVHHIALKNSALTYQEHVKGSPKAGAIDFKNLEASAKNIKSYLLNSSFRMKASADIMANGKLELEAKIPISKNSLPYELSGTIYKLDLPSLNPMLNHVARTNIRCGTIYRSPFRFTHNASEATGELELAYEDLNVEFINAQGSMLQDITNSIKSFIANSLVVKSSNPRSEEMRIGQIDFKRDPKKSLINFWWKSLLSGIKSSTGIKEAK